MRNIVPIVILAGGKGTRLGKITKKIPKPLVRVQSKPFLGILIDNLIRQGFKDFVLSVGYKKEQIIEYFTDHKKSSVSIVFSTESKPSGTGGAIKLASKYVSSDFIVINGDTYDSMDYNGFVKFAYEHPAQAIVRLYSNRDRRYANNCFIEPTLRITEYSKGSNKSTLNCVDAGSYFFRRNVFSLIPENRLHTLEYDLLPTLARNSSLYGYLLDLPFYDIGTPAGLANFKKYLQSTGGKIHT